jgi:ubiquinone/menaquinone biosynthesis C-methylase UbiE
LSDRKETLNKGEMSMKKICFLFLIMGISLGLMALLSSAQSHRDQRDQPEKLMEIAGVESGMVIGEAGAGSGYLTFFLSHRVGDEGRIYANDINKRALENIIRRCEREGVTNIEVVLGEIEDPCFPVNDLDMVIMLYAFHDFTEKEAWLKNARKYMKQDAPLVIFDGQDAHTGMSEELVMSVGKKAGFELVHYASVHGGLWVYILKMNDS